MQILETDKCKWHISCSPPLSMPQNKNNELLVFCPDIIMKQYHVMSMSYGNRQTINYSSYKPDAAANAKYNLEILNVPSYVYINSFVILVYVSQSSSLSSYLHSFNSCDTEMWILSSTSIIRYDKIK